MKKSIFKKLTFLAPAALLVLSFLPSPVQAAIPASPSGLYAIAGSGQVELHWTDNSMDETGFNVERAPDIGGLGPGDFAHLGPNPSVSVNMTAYTDATVVPTTAYWYRVSAVNASGNSFYSNQTRILTLVSTPGISLTAPAGGSLHSGVSNALSATASVSGTTITSAEYQLVANNAPGVFDARDIYATQMDLTMLDPRAATSANNTAAMPAGLPAGSVAEFEIMGRVSAYNSVNGVWTIGDVVAGHPNQPFTVYESVTGQSQSTRFIGSRTPIVGDMVKVVAYRNAAGEGPLVARAITYIAPLSPLAAPALTLNLLYNGVVLAMDAPVMAPGYSVAGEIWTIGDASVRIDAPYFPAYVDANVGMGTAVTVRFGTNPASAYIARNIFNQAIPAIATTTDIHPAFDTTSVPLSTPEGSWLYIIVDGVISAYDNVLGVWTVGNEQVKCYQTANSIISPATVGDEVLLFCVRTLTPGPLVIESTFNILAGPLIQPYKGTAVEVHLMYNGVINTMSPNIWTVGPPGQPSLAIPFVVDDPEGKARIDPLPFTSFQVGMPVTVEWESAGEVTPDDANWAPMAGAGTTWTASLTTPAVPVSQSGTLFLRTTDATMHGSTSSFPVTLASMPTSAPAPAPVLNAPVIAQTSVGLTWTDSTNEDSYQVQRSTNQVNYTPIVTLGAGTLAYSDTTVVAGNTYYYRIAATNVLGTTLSNVVTAAVPTGPPASPANFSATAGLGGEVNLTWTDSSTNEASFRVERSTDNITFQTLASVLANTTSYMDMTGAPATQYYYRVFAVNILGDSTPTAPMTATTAVAQALPVSANLTATLAGTNQINLTWVAGTANVSRGVSGYRVMRSTDNFASAGTTLATVGPSVLSYSNSGLGYSTIYYYQVVAFNVTGDNVSNTAMATTGAAPQPPTGGGGGGGGVVYTPVALTGFTGSLNVNSSGMVQTSATLTTSAGVSISIASGTTMLNAQGGALTSLSLVSPGASPPQAPAGNVIMMTYDLGPNGATFNPALVLTLPYNMASLPAGVQESSLVIGRWNGTAWTMLPTTVDAQAKKVSASVSGFSYFAVLAPQPAATPTPTATTTPPTATTTPPTATTTPPTTTPPTSAPPTVTPTTTQPSPTPAPGGGVSGWLVGGLIVAGALIVIILIVAMTRTRRSKA